MDSQKIGGFLHELRKEKNLTQEQLAEILGVCLHLQPCNNAGEILATFFSKAALFLELS